jgi:hypothetical protein
MTKVFLS